jgi:DNA-binding NarL/FixJ family response regulator
MKLLVIDDHPMLRDGLAALLGGALPDCLILQAPDAPAGLRLAISEPGLAAVLLDLTLPGMDGFTALAEFQRSCPGLPIVVLSSSEEPEHVHRAFALGARGYIPKSLAPPGVVAALQLVLSGEMYLPPAVLAERRPPAGPLTERQTAVLALLSQGRSNKEIGTALGLSEKTVKAHVGAIFRALGAVNRTQAVSQARRAKLIP